MQMHGGARGTAGDDFLQATQGGIFAFRGNDTILATAQDDRSQIHSYAAAGDDLTYLDFDAISGFAHGHHVRGGSGTDTFDFINIDNVSGFVVGRIEDFDIRSDEILINGQVVDFSNMPDSVRIVAFNGHHDDPGSNPQPWLHISTPVGGDIFYSLEGARVDLDQVEAQEPHFLHGPMDPWALPEIEYIGPDNYLPSDFDPVSGLVIEDTDVVRADVLEEISGSRYDDLIASGLNNDTVSAGAGDDTVWAGSGNDVIYGGAGNDRIEGSTGDDWLDGGSGTDRLSGGSGLDDFAFLDLDGSVDVVEDFEPGLDRLTFEHPGVLHLEHLEISAIDFEGAQSTLILFRGADGQTDSDLGGVVLKGVTSDRISSSDFVFNDGIVPIEEEEQDDHDIILGTDSAELVSGTDASDDIYARGGNDSVHAGDGNDLLDGGAGRDDLTGGEGNDQFVFADFERGFDVVRDFSPGTDQIVIDHEDVLILEDMRFISYTFENAPSTLVRFLDEDGVIDKSMGGIVLKGIVPTDLSEEDFFFGDPPADEVEQGDEDDSVTPLDPIFGTEAGDVISAGAEANDIYARGGNDSVHAGDGNDLLDGGAGRDDLTGGEGNDQFVFADFERGFDVVRDFSPGTDQIVIDHEDVLILEDMRFISYTFENAPSTLVRFLDEDGVIDKSMGGIVLKGIVPTDLSEEDFFFGDPPADEVEQGDEIIGESGFQVPHNETQFGSGLEVIEGIQDLLIRDDNGNVIVAEDQSWTDVEDEEHQFEECLFFG